MAVFSPWTIQLATGSCLLLLVLSLGRFLHTGFTTRLRFKRIKAQGIPLIHHSWLLGHLPAVVLWAIRNPRDLHLFRFPEHVLDNYKQYFPGEEVAPPALYLDLWPLEGPTAFVIDPNLAAQFTQDTCLPKHERLLEVMMPLTRGLDMNALNGDEWKGWRTRFNPGFSARNIMALLPEIMDEVALFRDVLDKRTNPGGWGDMFQMEAATINLTFGVMGKAFLDIHLSDQSYESDQVKAAILRGSKLLYVGLSPARWFDLINLPRRRAISQNQRILDDYFGPLIQSRLESTTVGTKRETIVDFALRSFKPGCKLDKAFLDQLVQNVVFFLFAGHDTTATTICWIFHFLERRPDCLANLRAEHDAVLGLDAELAEVTILAQPHLTNSLPYTTAFIKEALRLYPPATTYRQSFEGSGFIMHKPGYPPFPTEGFTVVDSHACVQRNPEFWPRADEFIPERFLVPYGDPLYPPKNGWRPFEQPPRSCIGQELAMLEIKLVLCVVARRFDIEQAWDEWDHLHPGPKSVVAGERLYPVGTSTVHTKDGAPMRVRRRVTD